MKITDAAKHLGIHPDTLRRWAKDGKVKVAGYTPGRQRLFDLKDFEKLGVTLTSRAVERKLPTICYARVSSRDQAEDLKRQVKMLELYCSQQGWQYEVCQ